MNFILWIGAFVLMFIFDLIFTNFSLGAIIFGCCVGATAFVITFNIFK